MDILNILKCIDCNTSKIIVDTHKNPYRIITEDNGERTAYIFSVPIKSYVNNNLIDNEWVRQDKQMIHRGINSIITYKGKRLSLENNKDIAEIKLKDNYEVTPSLNGVTISSESDSITFTLKTDYPYLIRNSGTSFALMDQKHLPYLTISPHLSEGANGEFIPTHLQANHIGERKYEIIIYAKNTTKNISVEVNLYMPKLIFDTTIENGDPERNNVFGNYAILGTSEYFGKQRLLFILNNVRNSILDFDAVKQAEMYIPKFGVSTGTINAYFTTEKWCTFNTTWSTMPNISSKHIEFMHHKNYIKADVTELISKLPNYGLMLKNEDDNSYCALSTADSYDHPIILKIKYT